MNVGGLREELLIDPLGLNYAAMDDATAFASLTDASARPAPDRDTLSGAEIYEVVDRAEYAALSPGEQEELKVLLSLGDTIAVGENSKARAALAGMFGPASNTRAELLGLVTNRTRSRAQELGLGDIDVDVIAAARSNP